MMSIIKRFFLFFLINIIVITTITFVISILNLNPHISNFGIDLKALFLFCLIWGMGGSLISLLLSKKIVKWTMGIKIISPLSQSLEEKSLIDAVNSLSKDAGLKTVPDIGIYHSNEVNAFATGPTKNNSLIGISSGLINRMGNSEIRAVLAHEISHISNGDMVTMTLLQGIINAFVMFLSRALAYFIAVSGKNKKNNNFSYLSYHLFTFLFQTCFMILGSIGICAFSRHREYKADLGGARLAGKQQMIDALSTLRILQEIKDPINVKKTAAINSLKISNFSKKSFTLFATHPSLSNRIERLKNSY